MLRKCPDCTIEKAATEFGRASPRCRSCALIRKNQQQREANLRWLARNPDYPTRRNKRYYAENREQEKTRRRTYYEENKERVARASKEARNTDEYRAWKREHRRKNREQRLQQDRERRARDIERVRERDRLYYAKNPSVRERSVRWMKEHPEYNRFRRSMRRAAEKQATPIWADMDAMLAFYTEAVRLTHQTGIPHEVDHIYPLKSDIMCGLHCHTNLQVVPKIYNRKKKNRLHMHDGEVRCCAWPSIAVAMEMRV